MIDLVEHGHERRFDVGKIHHPAGVRLRLARDMDFHAERMPVQPRALVAARNAWQAVRRLDLEYLENVHIFKDYGASLAPVVAMGGLEPPTPAL